MRLSLERSLTTQDIQVLSSLKSANYDLIQEPPHSRNPAMMFLRWWASWAIPGAGMFSEAYMVSCVGVWSTTASCLRMGKIFPWGLVVITLKADVRQGTIKRVKLQISVLSEACMLQHVLLMSWHLLH